MNIDKIIFDEYCISDDDNLARYTAERRSGEIVHLIQEIDGTYSVDCTWQPKKGFASFEDAKAHVASYELYTA